MARMHTRRKGRAGSKKPLVPKKTTWQRYGTKEIEMVVVKLAKEDKTPSQIGLILRDTYGVPDAQFLLGKRISKILADHKIVSLMPEDITALIKRAALIQKHREINKQDETSKRSLTLVQSKIRRLAKYYKRVGRMPENWKYSAEESKLLV